MAAVYQQSAVVPFRVVEGHVEVLLVSNRSGKRWVLPKGLIEADLDAAGSAAKEAYEEAGVHGVTYPDKVARYDYAKWDGTCRVEVFLMRVQTVLDAWPESSWRRRAWFAPDELHHVLDERVPGTVVDQISAAIDERAG
jgi:8-oxo-dGTP pyrophosphatase MutT (NUDIX family)